MRLSYLSCSKKSNVQSKDIKQRMEKTFQQLIILSFGFLSLQEPVSGLQSWCQSNSEGFELEKEYNPNSPPTTNFSLKSTHILMQIDEVRKVKYNF